MVAESKPLFSLGQVVTTLGAIAALAESGDDAAAFLRRHHCGDWGNVDSEDWALNDAAVKDGSRILSSYRISNGTKIWIITEADRSSTCVLLPDEY